MKEVKVDENKITPLRVNDKTDSLTLKHTVFNLPMRCILCAKSGQGKNTQLLHILCNENMKYNKIFKGEDIYIFCPDPLADAKMKLLINFYDIDDNNLYSGEALDEDSLSHVYHGLIDEFKEDRTKKPVIIIDDYSSTGKASTRFNIINTLFCNSRKYNINIFFLSQHYSHTSLSIRNNANVLLIGNCSNKNLKLICDEHNMLKTDKEFRDLFRKHTTEQFQFFIINYTSPFKRMYLNSEYKPIEHSGT